MEEDQQIKTEARKVAKATEVFRPTSGEPGFFFFIGKALGKADIDNIKIIKSSWPKMWDHYLGLWEKFEEIHAKS